MRWFLVIVCVASVLMLSASAKQTRKTHTSKKASSQKPTKHPKPLVDLFSDFPADDREFIKQLDKQFEKFGDNIKIKVQKVNATTSKNSKRTIDGSLGYGHYGNQHGAENQGFYFSKPQQQYSPHDITPSAEYAHQHEQSDHPGYDYSRPQRLHTTVEIQRSHEYEIKPDDEYRTIFNEDEYQRYLKAQNAYQQQHHLTGSQYDGIAASGPVIVLRIPGPAKYAAHLQALLQQYLEVRAAQYIQALQEEEARSQQYLHQPQQQQEELQSYQPHLVHQSYDSGSTPLFHAHHEPNVHIQPHGIAHEQLVEPESVQQHESLSEHPIVYHDDEAEQQQQQHQEQYQDDYDQGYIDEQKQIDPSANGYHYDPPEHSAEHLLTHENYPDEKHTQVIFKSTTPAPQTYLTSAHIDLHHHEPHHHVVQPQQYLHETTHIEPSGSQQSHHLDHGHVAQTPLVYQQIDQYYGSQGEFLPSNGEPHPHSYTHGQHHVVQSVSDAPENYVTITQRTPAHHVTPYNYHAHPLPAADDDAGDYVTPSGLSQRGSKRQAQFTENQMKKFSAIMSRMKAKMNAMHGRTEDAN